MEKAINESVFQWRKRLIGISVEKAINRYFSGESD